MRHSARARLALSLAAAAALAASSARAADDLSASLKKGTPDLKSAGPLAFGPEGILFVGDTQGAAVFAIDTGDRTEVKDKAPIQVDNVVQKVAARLGTDPQRVMINDVAINPLSGKAYLAVSRGRGPEATPVILRVNPDGAIEEMPLDGVRFAKTEIPNAPAPGGPARGGETSRAQSITDLAYVDGRLFVAGLSNEDWNSRLLAIPFPFSGPPDGASIQIYHGNHGRLETQAPVRTFVPYKLHNEPYLLAAYTCTPLVKVPVAELKAGAHVKGTTIAELGNRNRPLDMVAYEKDGKSYLLLANSDRGVMKIPTEGADAATPITARVNGTQGLGYQTIDSLKGVMQLDQLDARRAVILARDDSGALNLKTIDLP
jgi:hypothetical protein